MVTIPSGPSPVSHVSTSMKARKKIGFPTALDCQTRLYDSPEGRAVIFEDLARFLDLGRSEATFTGEYVLRS